MIALRDDRYRWKRDVNWREGLPWRFESLWSVVHKFCWLNAVKETEIVRRFWSNKQVGATSTITQSNGHKFSGCDLRFAGRFNLKRFSRSLGVGRRWIQEATLDGVGDRDKVRCRTASHLRFCSPCIQQGFHSVAFQCYDVKYCPVHDALLEEACPCCGRRIPYSFPARKSQPYGCECGRLLWWGIRDRDWPIGNNQADFDSAFNHVFQEFVWPTRPERNITLTFEFLLGRRYMDPSWEPALKGRIAGFTTELKRSWFEKFESHHWDASPHRRNVPLLPIDDTTLRKQLFVVFNNVSRAILRKYSGLMRRRLRNLKKVPSWGEMTRESAEYREYVLWKAYWIGLWHNRRRRAKPRIIPDEHRLEPVRLCWRFLQHAKLLRSTTTFTSADAWSYFHFLASVLFESFRVASRQGDEMNERMWEDLINKNRCVPLERTTVPVMILSPIARQRNSFVLRIRPKMEEFEELRNNEGDKELIGK